MTERRGRDLEQWITTVAASSEPALRSFITGLRRDQDAVTAGLPVALRYRRRAPQPHQDDQEAYDGRASPDLLRKRILLAD